MEKENSKKTMSFAQLVGMLGSVSLSNAGIEVIACDLENPQIHADNMEMTRSLKKKGKVVLGIGILPFASVGENAVRESLERASAFQRAVDGCILLNK